MTREIEQEADRVRAAYARRDRLGLDSRYAFWDPANLFIFQSRERSLLRILRRSPGLPLAGQRILDAGCGDGALLRDLQRFGARPQDLSGLDLLEERIQRARDLTPGASIEPGDAQAMPYADASFDLILGFTLLSSVGNTATLARVASELARVARPGGLLVIYDFWTNPFNRDVRPLHRKTLKRLFPDKQVEFLGVTLVPPLVRLLSRVPGGWFACTGLEMVPFLRTHYLAAIHF